jgi:hypothetical protein
MSRENISEQNQTMRTVNEPFENVAMLKYVGTTQRNLNCMYMTKN